jgi:hypothetical protein
MLTSWCLPPFCSYSGIGLGNSKNKTERPRTAVRDIFAHDREELVVFCSMKKDKRNHLNCWKFMNNFIAYLL